MSDQRDKDCKTCAHACVQFERESDGRFNQQYIANGYARCSAPRYKGRSYFVNVRRGAKCPDYTRPTRDS